MDRQTLTIAILAFLIVLLALAYVRLRFRQTRAIQAAGVPTPPTPQPRWVKCHIKSFHFADGHVTTRHSLCGGYGLDGLTDEKAAAFHTAAKLVSVTNESHPVRAR